MSQEISSDPLHSDIHMLVRDAQSVLQSVAELSGDKADEARDRGMQLLDMALSKTRALQEETVASGKRMLASGNGYVHAHPWNSVAMAITTGVLFGLAMRRK